MLFVFDCMLLKVDICIWLMSHWICILLYVCLGLDLLFGLIGRSFN